MNNLIDNFEEPMDIVGFLMGRYGRLALTRAAGEADAAARRGDPEKNLLWSKVIDLLRTMAVPASEPMQA